MRSWKETVVPRLPLLIAIGMGIAATCYAVWYVQYWVWYTDLSPDEGNYIATAQRLLSDHIFSFWGHGPDAYVSPGYPLFLAFFFALFGSGIRGIYAVRYTQCVLAGATVFLTYLLGKTLTRRDSVGLIAAALILLSGGYYPYPRMMLTETLYFFLMMLSFLLAAYAEERDSPTLSLWAGVVFGITVMVRSLVVATLPFLILPRLLRHRRDRSCSLRPVRLFLAGFLIPCLPWWIRNVVTMHRLILWATQTNPFFAGLAPDVEAAGLQDPGTYLGNFRLLFHLLTTNPRATLSWMTFGKFRILFMSDDLVPMQTLSEITRNFAVYLGLPGAVLAFLSPRTRLRSLPFWIYFICIFFSVPTSRYCFQYLLLLSIFAGWLVTEAWERIRSRDIPAA